MLQIARTFGLRDGWLRLAYEAERGSGFLSRRMQSHQGWDAWNLRSIAPDHSAEELLRARREGKGRFFFRHVRELTPSLKKILGPEKETSARVEADAVLAGTLPFFGRLSFACGFPPNWFQNPVTGQQVSPDRRWTTMRFASEDYGDLKFILEPSRFLFIYPLARAYALTLDERYPEEFWSAIEDWARKNPPMSGPLWICGQECSLRILAWSFAFHTFLHSPATTPQRMALLCSMVAAHAWRTEQTIGYARSQRSNHVFSEAVGLWSAGTLFPELKGAAEWRQHGMRLLREAVRDQITPEGAYLQDSFNYQRMVLHQLLWTIRLAELHDTQLHPDIAGRTAAAFEFLGAFVDSRSGGAPNHGSNDGSHILPLSACDFGDYRPLIQLGSRVLGRTSGLHAGPWDEAALWLCGEPVGTDGARTLQAERSFNGYHRLGNDNSWALVRAGSYKRRPFQADQLHVDLWWRGLNVARDAGTYLYNGQPPWNNGLAGTQVHNTIVVDGCDQMRRAGRFLWLDWAQARGRSFSGHDPGAPDSFEGEHDGYKRIGVSHKRMVVRVSEDAWIILDDMSGRGEHEIGLHWLVPDLPCEEDISEPGFSATLVGDGHRFHWSILSSAPGQGSMVREGKRIMGVELKEDEQILGWESPTYGELRPAVSLLYSVRARLPIRLVTAVLVGDAYRLRCGKSQISLWAGDSKVYEAGLAPGTNWQAGAAASEQSGRDVATLQSSRSPL